MSRRSKRCELLDNGVNVLQRWGYTAATIERIAEAAGVSKGGFFIHFGSKETFAIEALRRYFDRWRDNVEKIMNDPNRNAAGKLRAMIEAATDHAELPPYSSGCLISNFSAELSSEHDNIRSAIAEIFQDSILPFETVIAAGQEAGEFKNIEPALAARFIVSSLQGALLRCKIDRVSTALDDLNDVVFNILLSPEAAGQRTNQPSLEWASRALTTDVERPYQRQRSDT